MNFTINPTTTAACLLAASFVGALLPLYRKWSERGLHVFISISAGIFLGTIFLHLLPHLAGVGHGEGHAGAVDTHDLASLAPQSLAPWVAALAGLLLLFLLERVWLPSMSASAGADPHRSLWAATFVGLSLHSATTGVALTAIIDAPGPKMQFLASILIHKATETFSLATVMRLANLRQAHALFLLLLFAAIEPAGLVLGSNLMAARHGFDAVLTGFACGTFLYVAICDLLPEVFHGMERPGVKMASVALGIGLTAVTLPGVQDIADFGRGMLVEAGNIFVEMAPYLILGFIVAGVLHRFMKPERLSRRLAKNDLRSVAVASLVGAPLPLCSCSVIPVAAELRRGGASKGATAAFLIATPETGVDSVTVSWALLDPLLTVARFVGAILSAVFTGSIVNWLVKSGHDREEPERETRSHTARSEEAASEGDVSCCNASAPAPRADVHDHGAHDSAAHTPAQRGWLSGILHYAFVEMLDDLVVSMLVGILLSSVVAVLIPAELFQSTFAQGFSGLVLMLVIGMPVYVCASASTPIAAALILKGMSPGAALVFLLAGPATNFGSLFVVSRLVGRRVVLVIIGALAVVTLAIGWTVDQLYPLLGLSPRATLGAPHEGHSGWFAIACAILLGAMMAGSLLRMYRASRAPSALLQTSEMVPQ